MTNNKNNKDETFGLSENHIHELLKQAMREAGYKTYIDVDGKERPLNEENA